MSTLKLEKLNILSADLGKESTLPPISETLSLNTISNEFRLDEDDGLFIVSGIITERENDVLNALDKNNFKVLDRSEKKGWVCIKTNR